MPEPRRYSLPPVVSPSGAPLEDDFSEEMAIEEAMRREALLGPLREARTQRVAPATVNPEIAGIVETLSPPAPDLGAPPPSLESGGGSPSASPVPLQQSGPPVPAREVFETGEEHASPGFLSKLGGVLERLAPIITRIGVGAGAGSTSPTAMGGFAAGARADQVGEAERMAAENDALRAMSDYETAHAGIRKTDADIAATEASTRQVDLETEMMGDEITQQMREMELSAAEKKQIMHEVDIEAKRLALAVASGRRGLDLEKLQASIKSALLSNRLAEMKINDYNEDRAAALGEKAARTKMLEQQGVGAQKRGEAAIINAQRPRSGRGGMTDYQLYQIEREYGAAPAKAMKSAVDTYNDFLEATQFSGDEPISFEEYIKNHYPPMDGGKPYASTQDFLKRTADSARGYIEPFRRGDRSAPTSPQPAPNDPEGLRNYLRR